jgi:hypothetical protein
MDMQDRPRVELQDVSALKITCAECGNSIDKLPFMPTKRADGTYGNLYCYDCNKKRRPAFRSRGGFGR